jgi:hypothetical protein
MVWYLGKQRDNFILYYMKLKFDLWVYAIEAS